jgi:hypothetical protein
LKKGCAGWRANPEPFDFLYFLIYHNLTWRLPKGGGTLIRSHYPERIKRYQHELV